MTFIVQTSVAKPSFTPVWHSKDLISQMLEINPLFRLGSKPDDIEVIKNHAFFSGIDWEALANKEIEPPFVPDVAHDHDTSYVDRKLTRMSVDSNLFYSIKTEINLS